MSTKKYCVLKLFIKQRVMAQKRVEYGQKDKTIEAWKTRYALKNHTYEIYVYLESKLNPK